ncbi:hypothetical protein CROQUDRAFT_104417 [Cronartium quercuum f. sp. fusiforme G11]|uniref:RRM domain-containing protein n=1 Tax=Cronartium quercuum f. sp. fusiforme G11 TaxID=708437 RepID=A0A9P6NVI6_9BASI|nr:hypothetical protein CROQUDRAFT_104417 [Cronartium quercuum f. sp. fusiforme G11]
MASLLNRSLGDVRKSRDVAPPIKPLFGKSRPNQVGDNWKHDLFDGAAALTKTQVVADDARSPALLISNLHYDVSEAELEALFSQIGKIDRGPIIKELTFTQRFWISHSSQFVLGLDFDQSGRATEGLAFISYENETHAAEAIKAFNGAHAKGQPIGLRYEFGMPKWVRSALGLFPRRESTGTVSAPGLLGRIQEDRSIRRYASSPYDHDRSRPSRTPFTTSSAASSRGPTSRESRPARGPAWPSSTAPIRGARGSGRGRGGLDRSRGRASGLKSAQDLDKELEAFMDTTPSSKTTATKNTDVQMAE